MANARQRIVSYLVIALVGALQFVVASAVVIAHDLPAWLAGVVGAVTFPILPVGWHIVGERGRKARIAAAKKPPKSSLSGIDRFWLRAGAVAFVVLGPMIAFDRFDVARAAWHHALWFVPSGGSSSSSSLASLGEVERLVKRIPIDAELVIVGHKDKDATSPGGAAVLAWGNRQLMAAGDNAMADKDRSLDKVIDEINAKRDSFGLPFDKLAEVKLDGDTFGVATEGWRAHVEMGGAGPSLEVRAQLARAPKDAQIVGAVVPRTTRALAGIRGGAAWLVVDKAKPEFAIEARVEATDAAAAQKLVDEWKQLVDTGVDKVPAKCRDSVKKITDRLKIDRAEAVITARVAVSGEELFPLMFCAMGK